MTKCSIDGCDKDAHFLCNTCKIEKDIDFYVCDAHAMQHEKDEHDGMGMYGFKPVE